MSEIKIDTGLSQQDLKKIVAVICAEPKVKELILFGSRAKGTYRVGSDIDLAINTKSELGFSALAQIKASLEELMLPYEIDLLVLEKVSNDDLVKHIARVGIVLSGE